MMKFDVRFNIKEVQKFLTDAQKKYVPAAAGTALNRVGTTVRKVAQQKIRERLALSAGVARSAITIQRAGKHRLAVTVIAGGSPIPLRDYAARDTRKGVTFRVSKKGGRKRYQRQGRAGFILESKGGHVFVRTEDDPPGAKRGRIKKVYGPSLPQYFVTRVIREAMMSTAKDRWPIEFAAALRGVLIKRTGSDIGSSIQGLN